MSFVLQSWTVRVSGYGHWTYEARSRGMALSIAWGDFSGVIDRPDFRYKDFLKIVKCERAEDGPEFGAPITVGGQPAHFVSRNAQYVRFCRPDSDVIFSSHPYDVEPPEYRCLTYGGSPDFGASNTGEKVG
jgi:hypothetical protein